MAQVTVTIAGKTYRMACGDGEEADLERLAALLDGRIEEMRKAFGEIGDMRLHVMAALAIADELKQAESRIAALEAQIAAAKGDAGSAGQRAEDVEARAAATVRQAAQRVERIARALASGGQG